MPIPREIQQAVRKIDEKMDELLKMRRDLIKLFGGDDESRSVTAAPAANKAAPVTSQALGQTSSRAQQLAAFLERNGPSTRQEIIKGSQMPSGTVSFTLARNEFFVRGKDGRWRVVPYTKQAEPDENQYSLDEHEHLEDDKPYADAKEAAFAAS